MRSEKKVLLKNTLMLYFLRFSTYFFGFITVPYQTRVLGPEIYGKVGTAMALMLYFQLLIDFGFILSGTGEVARHPDDSARISKIYSAVQYLKMALIGLSFLILTAFCQLIPMYRQDFLFFLLYLVGTAVNGLVPDFVYRGLQQMGAVTLRVVISRVVFTLTLFLFLKGPEDYMVIPILSALGNVVALTWSLVYLHREFNIKLEAVRWPDLRKYMRASSTFFLSRIAGTVQSNLNVLILREISPYDCGLYSAADKLYTTGQGALSPISDSVYPYMTQHKDFKLIKRILLWLMPPIALVCVLAYVFAPELCVLIFGKAFAESGRLLRGLMPAALMTLPDYLFGFVTMTALGITKHANYSIYLSSGVFILCVPVLHFMGRLDAVHLAWMISLSMLVDLSYRLYQVRRRWRQLKQGQ